MSILIKGMEMPSCEVGCRAYMDSRIWNDGTVEARIGPKETEYKAVPVPPHGRLIDADAVAKMILGTVNQEDAQGFMFTKIICQILKNVPTIIPAEEGEA